MPYDIRIILESDPVQDEEKLDFMKSSRQGAPVSWSPHSGRNP